MYLPSLTDIKEEPEEIVKAPVIPRTLDCKKYARIRVFTDPYSPV